MIHITIFKDSAGICRKYRIEGHAGYGEHGRDIICAAVSVLAQNTANSIERFTSDPVEGVSDQERGYLEVAFPKGLHAGSQLLVRSMISGFRDIEKIYGSGFIRIREEEV